MFQTTKFKFYFQNRIQPFLDLYKTKDFTAGSIINKDMDELLINDEGLEIDQLVIDEYYYYPDPGQVILNKEGEITGIMEEAELKELLDFYKNDTEFT